MFGIGAPELIIIAIIALLIFGPSKLPELGKTIGKGLKEFRNASSNLKDQINPLSGGDIENPQSLNFNGNADNLIENKKIGAKKPAKRTTAKNITASAVSGEKPAKPLKPKSSVKSTAKKRRAAKPKD
jgi:TatA/E family protein of Tat protein translocase